MRQEAKSVMSAALISAASVALFFLLIMHVSGIWPLYALAPVVGIPWFLFYAYLRMGGPGLYYFPAVLWILSALNMHAYLTIGRSFKARKVLLPVWLLLNLGAMVVVVRWMQADLP
jgi:hypothetical protein